MKVKFNVCFRVLYHFPFEIHWMFFCWISLSTTGPNDNLEEVLRRYFILTHCLFRLLKIKIIRRAIITDGFQLEIIGYKPTPTRKRGKLLFFGWILHSTVESLSLKIAILTILIQKFEKILSFKFYKASYYSYKRTTIATTRMVLLLNKLYIFEFTDIVSVEYDHDI